ncbi:hypothetical protein QG37_00223 [Candidozyma auris]|uniref:Uncharacterized protein n=1 Tax=Candidozyma auris TaxID=498019 RepID=A0A0L0P9D7_CANAR|nr:hypothetical protein QG37_00223 [[Candida] auris]
MRGQKYEESIGGPKIKAGHGDLIFEKAEEI